MPRVAGQLAGTDFGNTRAQRDAKKGYAFAGSEFGWIRLKNGEQSRFEIMGQAGVFPTMHPNSAKVALGWSTWSTGRD